MIGRARRSSPYCVREEEPQDAACCDRLCPTVARRLAPSGSTVGRGVGFSAWRTGPEPNDVEAEVAAIEERQPGYRAHLDQLTEVVRLTTSLWTRREELGLTVDEVASRSGLSLDEVPAIENNAVDSPVPSLARYAAAVGLRLDVRLTAA